MQKRYTYSGKNQYLQLKTIKKFERYGMKDKVHLLKYRRSSAVNIYRIRRF
ncbi:MAG: hypothetical protein ACLUR5_03850 [Eubacterium ventriosum]